MKSVFRILRNISSSEIKEGIGSTVRRDSPNTSPGTGLLKSSEESRLLQLSHQNEFRKTDDCFRSTELNRSIPVGGLGLSYHCPDCRSDNFLSLTHIRLLFLAFTRFVMENYTYVEARML